MREDQLNRDHFNSEVGKIGITDELQLEGLWNFAKEKTKTVAPIALATGIGLSLAASAPLTIVVGALVGFAVGKKVVTQVMDGGDKIIRELAKGYSQHGRKSEDDILNDSF